MTPDKAVDFQFDLTDHYTKDELDRNTSGVLVGDNVRIILNQQNRVGLPEIQAGFLSSPGVNCAKVCDKWVENHFCLLVWKLCCLERSYPDVFKGK
ncbi:breast cancer type 2 susceptibility protein homolog [Diaphorina citri]|uniref:Breast cancer type 2 susceptibility protein homolog n=1 Tax=Diaphorina citri TaxID=121845 RepID=A0A1S3DR90_DIACI|nr:breast cancer type 2 susceptibility protein homolog [Diaphorina citri]